MKHIQKNMFMFYAHYMEIGIQTSLTSLKTSASYHIWNCRPIRHGWQIHSRASSVFWLWIAPVLFPHPVFIPFIIATNIITQLLWQPLVHPSLSLFLSLSLSLLIPTYTKKIVRDCIKAEKYQRPPFWCIFTHDHLMTSSIMMTDGCHVFLLTPVTL